MYNSIIEGLSEQKELTTTAEKEEYLQSLKPSVRGLRDAYWNYPIQFDYRNENVQAGYLITYVPHYTDLLYRTLNLTKSKIAEENINTLVCFGSGPCPEIVGFLRYLNKYNIDEYRNIKLTVWDISATEWKWSRDIVCENVVPQYINDWKFNRSVGTIDLSERINITLPEEQSIIVFQNCLNEIIPERHPILKSNIKRIFKKMLPGSYVVFIDLDFWQTLELLTEIENEIIAEFKCEIIKTVTSGGIQQRTTQDNEPRLILDNLLTDRFGETPTGLLPKRNLKYISSLIRKAL